MPADRVNPELANAIIGSLSDRIVVIDADGLISAANPAWMEFARTRSDALTRPISVGANYFDFCRDRVAAGCQEMTVIPAGVRAVAKGALPFYQSEYTQRALDNEWCLVTATPLRAARASAVVAHTNFNRDVSASLFAGQASRDVTSRLITAQENERIRIGRELHDDLGQQAALLAVKLDELSGNARISAARLRAGVADAERLLHELAVSIHELSHQLHPAKLKLLGLVATLEGVCRDSGATFSATAVPADVPEETALCVYRVTQEALQNAVKHSGAEHIHVQLGCSGTHLTLRVSDNGSGFDPGSSDRAGIGLVTMHERVELSGGWLKIHAARSTGTVIEATIPLFHIDSNYQLP
jgi:signal transduction histidine kinase